jgi:AcrR family transcriptional regulator
MPYETSELTPKAQHTRQQILDTALALFIEKGYEATTMREVAKVCDCSLGLTYRYFSSKEQLLLEFYWQMAAATGAQIEQLPPDTIADRFHALMSTRLAQTLQYRELFRVIFGVAMNPNSGVNILSSNAAGMRADVAKRFAQLVAQSTNPPSKAQIDDLAMLLYVIHFGVIMFWLYDRSPNQHTTAELLAFIRDLLRVGRPFLGLPFVQHALVRASNIAQALLNGQ